MVRILWSWRKVALATSSLAASPGGPGGGLDSRKAGESLGRFTGTGFVTVIYIVNGLHLCIAFLTCGTLIALYNLYLTCTHGEMCF